MRGTAAGGAPVDAVGGGGGRTPHGLSSLPPLAAPCPPCSTTRVIPAPSPAAPTLPRTAAARTGRPARALLVGLALLCLAHTGAPARADGDYEAALSRYRVYLKRPAFVKRTLGRKQLLATGDLRAFSVVVGDYLKPEKPQDAVRNSIVTLVTNHFAGQAESVPLYADWRSKCATPSDAWLWHRALRVETALAGSASAAAAAADPKLDPFLRAAALRALGTAGSTDAPALALAAIRDLPTVPLTRELLLEAAADVLAEVGTAPLSPECAALADRVVAALDDPLLHRRSRYVIARALSQLFGTHVLGTDSKSWARELAAAKESGTAVHEDGETRAPGRFFGLSASGMRTVYVIDTSDSMLTPLTPEERIRLKKRVTTGDDAKAPAAGSPDDDVPWATIRNRFDLAREVLKLTLRTAVDTPKSKADAGEERRFAVVLFGDAAVPLGSTTTLVALNATNVKAVAAELDARKPGLPKVGDPVPHPYGVLLGATNLHAGIRTAFRLGARPLPVQAKGAQPPKETPEYVEPRGFDDGADTIFVLSDGEPTWDDWPANDAKDPEDQVGDPETHFKTKEQPTLFFSGPFAREVSTSGPLLLPDIERMNLFRRAEIHCVAIGEAPDGLLRAIADVGRGKFRRAGGDAPPDTAQPPK